MINKNKILPEYISINNDNRLLFFKNLNNVNA